MDMFFQQHNTNLTDNKNSQKTTSGQCSCRNKDECPLNGNCLQSTVTYEANVTTNTAVFPYIGITEGPFKPRFSDHNKSFNHEKYKNYTELSKKVWDLKEKGINYNISWKIIDRTQPYRGGSKYCNLCVTEKYHILMHKSKNLLNSRSEIISKCRHTNKFMLNNCKPTIRNNPNG